MVLVLTKTTLQDQDQGQDQLLQDQDQLLQDQDRDQDQVSQDQDQDQDLRKVVLNGLKIKIWSWG